MKLYVELGKRGYPIIIEKGAITKISEHIDLNRKVMIITDSGVPSEYVEVVKKQCSTVHVHAIPMGEKSKSMVEYEKCLSHMLECSFGRNDLIIALGGGVVGDLAGFVAATYMRGIEFINIATTTLSQIDSSIGGKVAIDLNGTKNCVGVFHQPITVLIDPNTLNTLPSRHFYNGLVEALKMGLTFNESLVNLIEEDAEANIEQILYESLLIKKNVVEEDEFELGIRKVLNFGHTLGHAIESTCNLEVLLHGEAVAIGMLKVIDNEDIKKRVQNICKKWKLPIDIDYNKDVAYEYMLKDKKGNGTKVSLVLLDKIGHARIEDVSFEELRRKL